VNTARGTARIQQRIALHNQKSLNAGLVMKGLGCSLIQLLSHVIQLLGELASTVKDLMHSVVTYQAQQNVLTEFLTSLTLYTLCKLDRFAVFW